MTSSVIKLFHNIDKIFLKKIYLTKILEKILINNKLSILDVGASGITERNKFNYSLHKNFTKIYKSDDSLNKSNDNNDIYINNLFWSEEKKMNFNITKNLVSSSLYKPNDEILKNFINHDQHNIISVKSLTTKKIEDEEKISNLDFLKIDAEGAELEILKGCGDKINEVIGIEIESQFIERYIESPLFDEVHSFLKNKGFELYLINSENWIRNNNYINSSSNHKIIWGDFVYFKKIEHIERLISLKKDENILEKLIILLVMYKFYDEAIFLLNEMYNKRLLSENLKKDLSLFISDNKDSNINIFFKSLIHLFFSILILVITLFISRYRKQGIVFFKKSFREFFHKLGDLFKVSDKDINVIRDLKL